MRSEGVEKMCEAMYMLGGWRKIDVAEGGWVGTGGWRPHCRTEGGWVGCGAGGRLMLEVW